MLVDLGRNDLSRVCRAGHACTSSGSSRSSASRTSRTSSRRSRASCATASTPFDLLRATLPGRARSPARRRCGRCRSSRSSRATGAASTPASVGYAHPRRRRSTRASRSARCCSHDGVALPAGGRRHRRRLRPGGRAPGVPEQARRASSARSSWRRRSETLMLLLIDNYDSFTYNLAHLFGELGAEVVVRRNDEITVDGGRARSRRRTSSISPGPGPARGRGRLGGDRARASPGGVPVLGVCLGHQAIVERVRRRGRRRRATLVHGKATNVSHDGRGLFAGLPEAFAAGRYHSLAATSVPDVPRGVGDVRRRRGDGRAPPRAAGRRRAVPSRVGADAGRAGARRELPGGDA